MTSIPHVNCTFSNVIRSPVRRKLLDFLARYWSQRQHSKLLHIQQCPSCPSLHRKQVYPFTSSYRHLLKHEFGKVDCVTYLNISQRNCETVGKHLFINIFYFLLIYKSILIMSIYHRENIYLDQQLISTILWGYFTLEQ